MKDPTLKAVGPSTPDTSGVEFGRSAHGLTVARIGDLDFAMVPERDGQYFLSSAWCVSRPLADLTGDDFYSHHGRVESAWAAVAVAFPDLFTGLEQRCAARTLKDWEPDAWETISGTRLAPGESHTNNWRAFEQQYAHDWVVISAVRSDYQAGMTEAIATRGGRRDHGVEERRFLVPSADYKAGCFDFVIDENRQAAFDGPSSFASWTGRGAA